MSRRRKRSSEISVKPGNPMPEDSYGGVTTFAMPFWVKAESQAEAEAAIACFSRELAELVGRHSRIAFVPNGPPAIFVYERQIEYNRRHLQEQANRN